MNSPADFEDLQNRVVKLEKQNLRLKQLGLVTLLLPALLLVMGQAPSKKTVEANEFILRDDSGNVRARLGMNPDRGLDYAEIVLLDSKGQSRAELFGGDDSEGLGLVDSKGKSRANFGASESGSTLSLFDSKGASRGIFGQTDRRSGEGAFLTIESEKANTQVSAENIDVSDTDGSEAILGTTELVTPGTGKSQKTSAASLVLFDQDKDGIWRAP